MSQQSTFGNRAVEEKAGVHYRPIRHGKPPVAHKSQPSPDLAVGAFSLLVFLIGAVLAALKLRRSSAAVATSSSKRAPYTTRRRRLSSITREASLFFHAMPDEMTSEVGECDSHCVKPVQNGIDCCPHIVLVWHLEDIAHNDLIID